MRKEKKKRQSNSLGVGEDQGVATKDIEQHAHYYSPKLEVHL